MANNSRLPVLLSAIIVAIGVAVVWGAVVGIGSQFLAGWFGSGQTVRESLHITEDGSVLIVSVDYNGYVEGRRVYRTLEGEEVEVSDQHGTLGAARLPLSERGARIMHFPVDWAHRIGATQDYGNPATYWFLICDPQYNGKAYYLVFDSVTRRRIGYADRAGFHQTPPEAEDLFDTRGHAISYAPSFYAGTGYMEPASPYPNFRYIYANVDVNPKQWIGFLLDRDRIWRIDMREREIITFHETSEAYSINLATEIVVPAAGPEDGNSESSDTTSDAIETRRKTLRRLAVRYLDRIELWNTETGEKKTFALPSRFANMNNVSVLSLGEGRLLLEALPMKDERERGQLHEIAWIDENEGEVRAEQLRLAGYRPPSPRAALWMAMITIPVLVAWGFMILVIAPVGMIDSQQAATYPDALALAWSEAWPPLVVLILISVLLAALVARRHRSLFGEHERQWAALVLVLGIPGLIAWRLMNAPPPAATCQSCGGSVQRDRALCSHCAEPFPAPELRGTEVFA